MTPRSRSGTRARRIATLLCLVLLAQGAAACRLVMLPVPVAAPGAPVEAPMSAASPATECPMAATHGVAGTPPAGGVADDRCCDGTPALQPLTRQWDDAPALVAVLPPPMPDVAVRRHVPVRLVLPDPARLPGGPPPWLLFERPLE